MHNLMHIQGNYRFKTLTSALTAINVQLRESYQVLNPVNCSSTSTWLHLAAVNLHDAFSQQGDCYIDFALDAVCFAKEGLQLMVNPDSCKWRSVKALSGGQQAACGIAVSAEIA